MPLVRIDMLEGRPREKLGELHGRVSALVAEILETPIERVRTIITEVPPDCWGIGGVPATQGGGPAPRGRRAVTTRLRRVPGGPAARA